MDPSAFPQQDNMRRQLVKNRAKMVSALVLVVGVGMAMFSLRSCQRRAETQEPKALTTQQPYERPIDGLDPGSVGKPPEVLRLTEEQLADAKYLTDPATLDQIADVESVDIEPGPFFYMIYKVSQDDPKALKAEALSDVAWDTLWSRPKEVRGKAITINGTVLKLWTQPLGNSPIRVAAGEGEDPVPLTQLQAYRIRWDKSPENSLDGIFDVYCLQKLPGVLRKDQVTVHGRFLKPLIVEPTQRVEDPDVHVAVVVAPRLEPLAYLDAPEPPKPIVDGNRAEARALYWFLNRLRQMPFAELREKADPDLTFLDLTVNTARYRGRPVVLRGELRRLVKMQLKENPLGLEYVYYGQIVDKDREMNTFYCLRVPEGIRKKAPVALYGCFLKKWTYVSEGRREVESPIFVGQRMLMIEIEPDYTAEIILGVVVGVTVIALLVAQSRERGRTLAASAARREREARRAPANLNAIARKLSHVHPKEADAGDESADEDEASEDDKNEA